MHGMFFLAYSGSSRFIVFGEQTAMAEKNNYWSYTMVYM